LEKQYVKKAKNRGHNTFLFRAMRVRTSTDG
jgi:hypothetical protein